MTERYGWDQTPTPDLGLDITKAPSDVQKLYKWIIEKMYGKDVASAYGQAMVLTGILAKNAEAMSLFTSGRMDALDTFVKDTLIELTDKDIISAPEIIMARNGEDTLSDRLVRDSGLVTDNINNIRQISNDRGINPRDFGVVADGITDDTTAMQSVIDYAILTKRRIELFGTSLISGELLINHRYDNRDPVRFSGNGIIKKVTSGYLFNSTSPQHSGNVRFNGVRFVSVEGAGTIILNPKMLIRVYFNSCDFINVDCLMSSVGEDYAQTIYLNQCAVTGGSGFFINLGTSYDVSFTHSVCEHRESFYKCSGTSYALRINDNVIEGMKGQVAAITHAVNFAIRDNYFEANCSVGNAPYIEFLYGVPGNTTGVIENNLFMATVPQLTLQDYSFIKTIALSNDISIKDNTHNCRLLSVFQEKSVRPNHLVELMSNKPTLNSRIVNNYHRSEVEMGIGSLVTSMIYPNLTNPTTDRWLPNTNVSAGVTNKGIYVRAASGSQVFEAGFKLHPIYLREHENLVVGVEGDAQIYAGSVPRVFITIFDSTGTQVYRQESGHTRNVANNSQLSFVSLPSFRATSSQEYTIQLSLYRETEFTFETQYFMIRNLFVQYGTIATKSSIQTSA